MSINGFIKRTRYWREDKKKGSRVRRHYDELGAVLKNADYGRKVQQQRLSELLAHATAYSEFFKPYAGKSISDFPVTNKQVYIQNHDAVAVAIENIPEQETEKLYIDKTSGSTGTPFEVFHDSRKRHRRVAELKYFGESVGFKSHEKLGQCKIWAQAYVKPPEWLKRENMVPIHAQKVDEQSLKEVCELVKNEKIVSLRAYAGWYEKLVMFLEEHREYTSYFRSVKVAISISEALSDVARQKMKEMTGVPIVECYADMEAGLLAHQRVDDNNYYLNHASYYFEILKMDSDEPAEYGELGRIVLTDLYNYAFPLIRYDTGDTAVLQKGNETSGGWDYISKLYGRRLDLIYDTSGKPVHPMIFVSYLKYFPGIVQWQFIQKAEREYCIKLSTNKEVDCKAVADSMKEIIGEDAAIEFELVDEIPVLASGKRKPVVNEWKKS